MSRFVGIAEILSIAAIIALGLQMVSNDITSGTRSDATFLPDFRIEDGILLIILLILGRTALLVYQRFLLAQFQAQSDKNIHDDILIFL